jgi:hypothetical protein
VCLPVFSIRSLAFGKRPADCSTLLIVQFELQTTVPGPWRLRALPLATPDKREGYKPPVGARQNSVFSCQPKSLSGNLTNRWNRL